MHVCVGDVAPDRIVQVASLERLSKERHALRKPSVRHDHVGDGLADGGIDVALRNTDPTVHCLGYRLAKGEQLSLPPSVMGQRDLRPGEHSRV